MEMKSKLEVVTFIESLQWQRMSKKELDKKFSEFFGIKMAGENSTCDDCKDFDYSLSYTTAEDSFATTSIIDVEIYYLKMRNRKLFITGVELLDYID